MRIKTWKGWHDPNYQPHLTHGKKVSSFPKSCRVVPESTWRKIVAVVNAASECGASQKLNFAMDDLYNHVVRKKS